MQIKVTIERSKEYVRARRLATGENVSTNITVPIDVSSLTLEAREILLRHDGTYPEEIRYLHASNHVVGLTYDGEPESVTGELASTLLVRAEEQLLAVVAEDARQRKEQIDQTIESYLSDPTARPEKKDSANATPKLCWQHHIDLCDKLSDEELDALGIPASDSGDVHHVVQEECEWCQEDRP
jgi:hypothetical protein